MTPNPRRKPPTKGENKLARRIRDYDQMMGRLLGKVPVGSFHKPGSNK